MWGGMVSAPPHTHTCILTVCRRPAPQPVQMSRQRSPGSEKRGRYRWGGSPFNQQEHVGQAAQPHAATHLAAPMFKKAAAIRSLGGERVGRGVFSRLRDFQFQGAGRERKRAQHVLRVRVQRKECSARTACGARASCFSHSAPAQRCGLSAKPATSGNAAIACCRRRSQAPPSAATSMTIVFDNGIFARRLASTHLALVGCCQHKRPLHIRQRCFLHRRLAPTQTEGSTQETKKCRGRIKTSKTPALHLIGDRWTVLMSAAATSPAEAVAVLVDTLLR